MVQHSDARGKYRVVELHRDAVWFHFEGWIGGELWPPTEQLLESVIDRFGTVLMLGNGSGWNGYEPAYRQGCTAWFLKRKREIRGVHLLVNSPVLRMGVQVVNLVVPIIHAYVDPSEFMTQATELVPLLTTYLHRAGLETPSSAP